LNTLRWSQLSPSIRERASLIPQSSIAMRAAYRRTPRDLRILGFHGVPDIRRFDALIQAVITRFQPVGADDVAAALRGDFELPDHAVWFTFDDGLPSTFQAGEALRNRGISATAFVCPSRVERHGWLWFEAVTTALSYGMADVQAEPEFDLQRLKTMPDDQRRHLVDVLVRRLAQAGHAPSDTLTIDDIELWRTQGHTIGNHTWDHPCLDACSEDVQRDQIARAHEAILRWGVRPEFFAYPNGNWTAESSQVLRELGYAGSLLFDHRLARNLSDAHRISRLRIDSDIDPRRAMSILTGAHSFAYHLAAG
jgi:peptidoglycan/xylan/chitin deacetylase (PgdA/CDA1 family)